jgi:tetratricopeptide (TPR) repeat protein
MHSLATQSLLHQRTVGGVHRFLGSNRPTLLCLSSRTFTPGLLLLICLLTPARALGVTGYRSLQNPTSPDASKHFQLAKSAEARADWRVAENEYREALKLAPDWPEALVNLGIVYNRQGKPDDALAVFNRAAEINPQLLGVHLNLAITYFRTNRFREAEVPLRRALTIEPENKQALGLLVLTLFALEQYNEVTELGERALKTNANDAATLEVLGRAYLRLRRYADAVRVLEARSRINPESAEILMLLGEARDNAGDSEGAVRDFKRGVVASGSAALAELHFALGYVLWKLRQYEEAESEFRRELARDPKHASSTYYLGNIALTRGDWKTALPFLEKAAAALPGSFDAHYDFGKALLRDRQVDRATSELQTAIKIDAKNSGAHYQLGLAYRQMKRESDAQREFSLARELNKSERDDLEKKVQGEELKKKPPE